MTKIAEVRTDANGAYSIKVPGGPSRVAARRLQGLPGRFGLRIVHRRLAARPGAGRLPRGDAARRAARPGAVRGQGPRRLRAAAREARSSCRPMTPGAGGRSGTVRTNRSRRVPDELLLPPRAVVAQLSLPGASPLRAELSVPARHEPERSASASAEASVAEEPRLVVGWALRSAPGGGAGGSVGSADAVWPAASGDETGLTTTRPSCRRTVSDGCARAASALVTGSPAGSSSSA